MSTSGVDRKGLVDALERVLRLITAHGVLMSESVAGCAGINSTDLECLDFIQMREVATAGDLAAATGLTSGAMTSAIDRLEKAGYVRREADPSDRRRVLVRVEPLVEAEIAPLYAALQRALHAAWEDYDEAELALVTGFLERTLDAAERELAAIHDLAGARAAGGGAVRRLTRLTRT